MCAEAGAQGPGPLSFLFSYQRPLSYQFQILQEQRERETTDRKGIFFLPLFPLEKFTECVHLHISQRGKQLLIRAQTGDTEKKTNLATFRYQWKNTHKKNKEKHKTAFVVKELFCLNQLEKR